VDLRQLAIYAIGDVHGCFDELISLERMIAQDAEQLPGDKLIIMLGDYIDRGPDSAQVIEHLMRPPSHSFRRICLTGNHEIAMLNFLDGLISLRDWNRLGAGATLRSYGLDLEYLRRVYPSRHMVDEIIRTSIPAQHVAFLRELPILVDGGSVVFVHAGVKPSIPLGAQRDIDIVTIRDEFYREAKTLPYYVIHGHTAVAKPQHGIRRINIDTGACFTGRLSALRLWNGQVQIIST
jgi:serine/threonine protein phosphatase 1